MLTYLFYNRQKPDWAKSGPGLKNTGKDTTNLQTPITNIKDVAEGDDKLAWWVLASDFAHNLAPLVFGGWH